MFLRNEKKREQSIKGNFVQFCSIKSSDTGYFRMPFIAFSDKMISQYITSTRKYLPDDLKDSDEIYRVGYFDVGTGCIYRCNNSSKPIRLGKVVDYLKRYSDDLESEVKENGNSSDKVTSCT